MSLVEKLFNKGLKEIEGQIEVLEAESENLVQATDKTLKEIDTAVKDLETAKDGARLAKDNITWLKIEIYRKSDHSFNELQDLYNKVDENELALTVFERLAIEKRTPAIEKVEAITDDFQAVLNAYDDEIEKLEALINEHASDTNKDDLKELAGKYLIILQGQKDTVNGHLADYDIKDTVR